MVATAVKLFARVYLLVGENGIFACNLKFVILSLKPVLLTYRCTSESLFKSSLNLLTAFLSLSLGNLRGASEVMNHTLNDIYIETTRSCDNVNNNLLSQHFDV